MKCPVCNRDLQAFNAGDFEVDICSAGCSGIWFDKDEFERCDESTETFPEELLRVRKLLDVVVDRSKIRSCPRCEGAAMERINLDPEIRLEIDHCTRCGGHWLDVGELALIRKRDKEDLELQERLKSYERTVRERTADADQQAKIASLMRRILK